LSCRVIVNSDYVAVFCSHSLCGYFISNWFCYILLAVIWGRISP